MRGLRAQGNGRQLSIVSPRNEVVTCVSQGDLDKSGEFIVKLAQPVPGFQMPEQNIPVDVAREERATIG
jgi:hypothetical protein